MKVQLCNFKDKTLVQFIINFMW